MTDHIWQDRLSRDYFSEFSGKGIIIAGGGQGIGAALAQAFDWLGAQVVILDRAPQDGTCGGSRSITADLAREETRRSALAEACGMLGGKVSGFVSTIGMDRRIALSALTQDEAEQLMRVNFYAPFFTARDLMPALRAAGGGAMCLFTSRHGSEIHAPDMTGYGCAKAALDSGIKRLAAAAGEENAAENIIRVFGFCPGWVQTPNQTARFTPGHFQQAAAEQLVPRDMRAEDIVPAVIFAMSRHAGLLSGTTLRFDGGEGQVKAGAVIAGSGAAA
jgi:3-oxoacyl-[acyl-carrier protein] reductase